jgi:carboxylesterase type B
VEESISIGKPIIVVTINYRLNIFAFGDTESEPNLALRDQRKAFGYIASHIGGFGGDPVCSASVLCQGD